MSLFPEPIRDPEELLASGLAVIDAAFASGAVSMVSLFSGGHDSICATHIASRHPKFSGFVSHIDTGIGAKETRKFVEYDACKNLGWKLKVYKSPYTFERFIRERGFPGPGRHHWVYVRIKERCIRQIVREAPAGLVALVTGCRSLESTRRMGHVEPIKVGEQEWRTDPKTGKKRIVIANKRRVWVAPCHDWSTEEQIDYMEYFQLPSNPLKITLGMSGECFCGAFASPGELNKIRTYAPDVAAEIDRLSNIARQCGQHDSWGTRPNCAKGIVVAKTGPLCTSCDIRAKYAGLLFEDM